MQLEQKLLAELLLEIKRLNANFERFQKLSTPLADEQWSISGEAWQLLKSSGVRSAGHLKRLRQDGVFREADREIRNVSNGNRPTWEYNIPKCHVALKRYFDRLSA